MRYMLWMLTFVMMLACNKSSDGGSKPEANQPTNAGPDNLVTEKEPDEEETPGDDGGDLTPPPADEEASLAVAGTLVLDLALMQSASPDKILAFPMSSLDEGSTKNVISADINPDDLSFRIDLPTTDFQLETLQAAVKEDGSIDREALEELYGPLNVTDEEIKAYIEERVGELEKSGGPSYLLVSMVSGDDPVAEAQSFRFIGLKSGGDDFLNIPVQKAKKDLDLGEIPVGESVALADVVANDELFDLSNETLANLAATDDPLKFVKNVHMNADASGEQKITSSLFFAFYGDPATTKNAVGPADMTYSGYGIYFSARGVEGLTLNSVCKSANPVALALVPPAAITDDRDEVYDESRPLTNVNPGAIEGSSSGRQECYASDDQIYVAADGGADELGVLWNWGAGGSLLGDLPQGIWKLRADDNVIANFDLASASPIKDGKPVIFMPRLQIDTNEANEIVGGSLRFAIWDRAAGEYKNVEDVAALDRLMREIRIELDDYDGVAGQENRVTETLAVGALSPAGVHTISIPTDAAFTWKYPGDASTTQPVAAISVSYKMHGSTYRFEFRAE